MRFLIRVDASLTMGSGHVMRCLSLATALREHGHDVRFVCRQHQGHLSALLENQGYRVDLLPLGNTDGFALYDSWVGASVEQDGQQTLALMDNDYDWVIVDHYGLDQRWQQIVRAKAKRIFVIDDLANRTHDCDLLLDQNLYHNQNTRYQGLVPAGAQLLLGPRYALLRHEFSQKRLDVQPRSGAVQRVLVFFGGMDADNYTTQAIQALAALNIKIDVDVVIGGQHPYRADIEARCAVHGYQCHVQTTQMATLMARADLAIGAGGSASWERCCMGLPALAISVADNQRQLVEDAAAAGLLYASDSVANLGLHIQALLDNTALRQLIAVNGWQTVDGRGIERVVRYLGCSTISMRLAVADDSVALFEWRNHPRIRQVSRSTALIAFDDHQRWLQATLVNPNRVLLIGMQDQLPIGVVRFDINETDAEVSIYLVPEIQKTGLGTQLLHSAELWLTQHRPEIEHIVAVVLGNNQPSHRLFAGSGYLPDSTSYSKRIH